MRVLAKVEDEEHNTEGKKKKKRERSRTKRKGNETRQENERCGKSTTTKDGGEKKKKKRNNGNTSWLSSMQAILNSNGHKSGQGRWASEGDEEERTLTKRWQVYYRDAEREKWTTMIKTWLVYSP